MSKRSRIAAAAAIATIAVVAWAAVWWNARRELKKLEQACTEIGQWAQDQSMPAGAYSRFQAPTSVALPPNSEVNLVISAQNGIVVFLKTHVGWKQNYEGVLYSTRPINPATISIDPHGRQQIDLPSLGETPVIKQRINPQFFKVYFDLG